MNFSDAGDTRPLSQNEIYFCLKKEWQTRKYFPYNLQKCTENLGKCWFWKGGKLRNLEGWLIKSHSNFEIFEGNVAKLEQRLEGIWGVKWKQKTRTRQFAMLRTLKIIERRRRVIEIRNKQTAGKINFSICPKMLIFKKKIGLPNRFTTDRWPSR